MCRRFLGIINDIIPSVFANSNALYIAATNKLEPALLTFATKCASPSMLTFFPNGAYGGFPII